jgi:hypothetical protein
MAQENAMGPVNNVEGYSMVEFVNFLDSYMSPRWGPLVVGQILAVYNSSESKQLIGSQFDAQRWYDTIGSDPVVTCGNLALATVAGRSFSSPVYSSYTIQGPSHPFPVTHQHNACHGWDLIVAGQGWPILWEPNSCDLSLSDNVLSNWLALMETGTMESRSWRPVSEAPVGHYFSAAVSSETTVYLDLLSDKCQVWKEIGVDRMYWWAN